MFELLTDPYAQALAAGFLGLVATAVAAGIWRERRQARAEHRAELAALDAVEPPDPDVLEEQRRASVWRSSFDLAIADVNTSFDRLVAGMPTSADEPLPADYWPVDIGPEPAHLELTQLAAFDAAATLEIIIEANAAPAVFSWSTGEMPLVDLAGVGAR